MPVTPTFPGVYIEEIPSGVRTITGVATSITAFIGRAQRGPTDQETDESRRAVTINSFADFERIFGGLWELSKLGNAVRDFYLNGGSQAIIVRLYRPETGNNAKPAKAKLDVKGLKLEAAYPGAWGNDLRAYTNHKTRPPDPQRGETADTLFNLFVRENKTGQTEEFRNVSVVSGHPRQVDNVLANESSLFRATLPLPAQRPDEFPDPPAGVDVWDDRAPDAHVVVADADKASDGRELDENAFTGQGLEAAKKGLFALQTADLFNILCIPPYDSSGNVSPTLYGTAADYCQRRRAMLLVDPPTEWHSQADAIAQINAIVTPIGTNNSKNAAIFFPRLMEANPVHDNQIEEFVPSGAIAGIFARTDTQRGVWKAPAGLDASLVGLSKLRLSLTNQENGQLNPLGINCLRTFPAVGSVVWGSRTLQGNDRLASEWKYIPVRRTALYIEESLYRGTQWVVFEPNDEPLWAQIRLNVGAFMQNLFRQGAFQGQSPRDAYFVKCDKETTTQNDINLGIVNIVVGFAPLKPAEFVIIKIQQIAGQIAV
jgi:phage tail sheath protein FI